jgi:hypothetical protein
MERESQNKEGEGKGLVVDCLLYVVCLRNKPEITKESMATDNLDNPCMSANPHAAGLPAPPVLPALSVSSNH